VLCTSYKSKNLKFPTVKFPTLIIAGLTILIVLLSGSPYSPSIFTVFQTRPEVALEEKITGPALEVGGTASSEIRKIVWTGAIDIWKHYPILGTGVETFAYSYYNFRPEEHNLVSEWDFLYNKAHNEYLNFLANTGIIGTLGYLTLIFFSLAQLTNLKLPYVSLKAQKNDKTTMLHIGLLSGYFSILLTNFFGFSVVPVALSFFLFPAIAFSLNINKTEEDQKEEYSIKIASLGQNISLSILLLITCYMLLVISRYWYADYLYAQGKAYNDIGNYSIARQYLQSAIKISEKEAIYWEEISESTTSLAINYYEDTNEINEELITSAINESEQSINLSPENVNLKRKLASNLINLSVFNPQLLVEARQVLITASEQAPTDAKIIYNLGLAYIRTGELDLASETLQKAAELKWDYKNAHYALALVEIDRGNYQKAYEELAFIIEKIDPNDSGVLTELADLIQKHPEVTK
jgi:putative inorganic carbon (hco3(-)) transporter